MRDTLEGTSLWFVPPEVLCVAQGSQESAQLQSPAGVHPGRQWVRAEASGPLAPKWATQMEARPISEASLLLLQIKM